MVEIIRKRIGNLILPPVCVHEISGKPCKHNGEVCACNVYSGNANLPLLFGVK